MTNIIGDIAGRYTELVELVGQMPEGEIISVGDMVDRGPDSKRVIEFFMKPGRRAIMGNHEHMMLDYLTRSRFYGSNIWAMNGGSATMRSYDMDRGLQNPVPTSVVEWIAKLPKYIEMKGVEINGVEKDVLISHAFLRPSAVDDRVVLEENCELGNVYWEKDETTILWNRGQPVRRETWDLQVCGHNSQFGLREWDDEDGTFAICLDDSRHRKLTGLHLESMTIYQVPYKVEDPYPSWR